MPDPSIAPAACSAVDRARAAQPQWAALSASDRIRRLTALRRHIAAARDEIVHAIMKDVGKPLLDALSAEVLVTLEQMLFYERHAARILKRKRMKKTHVLFTGCSFYEQCDPCGVVLIYAPANYPFQLAMVPAITALFAGNAVLLKLSEYTPAVASVIQALCDAVLPRDLVQVATDDAHSAREYIDAGPDLVFFTGSSENGKDIGKRAAAKLIPTILELGGKDPSIVFADCKLDRTVDGIAYGAFSNAGQVCVGIKRLYIERTIYRDFVDRLVSRVRSLRIGLGADSDLGTLRGEHIRARFSEHVNDALNRGAVLETGPDWNADAPVILSNVPPDSRLLSEESWGPVLCVSSFDTEAEAVAFANDSQFALSASVWTSDIDRATRIASDLQSGSCAINDVIRNIVNPYASFGGNRASGYGRYHGPDGLRAFSRVKSIMIVRQRRRRELHWFPFTTSTSRLLERWIDWRHRSQGWIGRITRLFLLVVFAFTIAGSAARV